MVKILISSPIINSFSQAIKYMFFEELKDVCMNICEILFLMGSEILLHKFVQAAINLGLKFRTTVVEQQQEKNGSFLRLQFCK